MNKTAELVVQSNNLVEAFYDSDLSATEHKIIRYAASKVKSNPSNFPTVTFGVKEFLDAGGLKGNGYHARIIKISDELTRKRIKIQNDKKIGWFPWLSSLVYEEGVVQLSFNPLIKNLLLELDGQFTKYNYKYISDMKSSYSIRLFELLKQYAVIGKRRFEVDTLKKMLGVNDKYPGYGQFKQKVLKQAQKELNDKEGLTFEFEEIKQGRKVVELVFFIRLKEKQLIMDDFLDEPKLEDDTFMKEAKFLLENYSFSIPDKNLKQWSKYGVNLLNNVLDEVQHRKMDYPVAYIQRVLESKHEERLKLKQFIKTESEQANDLILTFIEKQKSPEVIPDWFMKEKFDSYMKSNFSKSEIDELWEKNCSYLMKETLVR